MSDKGICPRCGAEMVFGICEECGFPVNSRRIIIPAYEDDDEVILKTNDVIWARKL